MRTVRDFAAMASVKWMARVMALLFFCMATAVLLIKVAWPPSRGFAWIFAWVFFGTVMVRLRVPAYIQWANQKVRRRWWRCTLDGLCMGVLMAAALLLIPGVDGSSGPAPLTLDRFSRSLAHTGSGVLCFWLVYILSCLWASGKNLSGFKS